MHKHSFTSRERIRKTDEFQLVYKEGLRNISCCFIWFFLSKNLERPKRRLGITVTKMIGKANVRVRIKRQVREFFRLNKDGFPRGMLVVKARVVAAKVDNKGLREDLKRGLAKLNLTFGKRSE